MRTLTPFWTTRNRIPDIWQEMDRLFEGFPKTSTLAYDEREFSPATEIVENENHYLLSVDLPGIRKEDIKIELNDRTLSVSGERRREQKADDDKIQRYEKSYGFFKRSFALPQTVSTDKIEAQYENGVLELYLPKAELAQSKKIEIQSGKSGFFDRLLNTKQDTSTTAQANKES